MTIQGGWIAPLCSLCSLPCSNLPGLPKGNVLFTHPSRRSPGSTLACGSRQGLCPWKDALGLLNVCSLSFDSIFALYQLPDPKGEEREHEWFAVISKAKVNFVV
jgi:hypothetical protein